MLGNYIRARTTIVINSEYLNNFLSTVKLVQQIECKGTVLGGVSLCSYIFKPLLLKSPISLELELCLLRIKW